MPGPTRTVEDALAHLRRLRASDPQATKWYVILDNLNIHQSEVPVHRVDQQERIAAQTPDIKGKKRKPNSLSK